MFLNMTSLLNLYRFQYVYSQATVPSLLQYCAFFWASTSSLFSAGICNLSVMISVTYLTFLFCCRFHNDEYGSAPFFLFGDFNFRTDTQGVIKVKNLLLTFETVNQL